MSLPYQAVLLIAFGGPTSPEEIRPFLARVTKGLPLPPERLEQVARHYEAVGGRSPLNEITSRQAQALENLLAQRGNGLPVYVGMRNAAPSFTDTLARMGDAGVKRVLGVILSSHRTEASWDRYQQNIADARAQIGAAAPEIDYCDSWHDHPLFIQTWVELLQEIFAGKSTLEQSETPLIFTAHSLPSVMADRSPYVQQLQTSAQLIAERLGHSNWKLAYQSRSGRPSDSWLEPDINRVIRDLAAAGERALVIAPIGFVCDHVEVLYDLDIEARAMANTAGIDMIRARCPNDHPTFIRMMSDVVHAKIQAAK